MPKKIALFGGSFDPVHTDHLNIAKACYNDLNFTEVWFIPAYLNPFKTTTYAPIVDRLAMLQILVNKYPWLKIVDYEIKSSGLKYTYETVKFLQTQYPDFEFSFIMGSDQLDDFEKWYNFDKLISMISFKIFLRSNHYNFQVVQKYKLDIFNFNNHHLSSTKIRGLEGLDLQIPQINNYINDNLLYLNERMKPFMDEKRFNHSMNTGKMAKELAQKWGVDPQKALIAGTLHDISKCWPIAKHQKYLAPFPDLLAEPVPVWHSFSGAIHLEKDWLIQDETIVQAVFHHTVGGENMNLLDIIVFCADKISSERVYLNVQQFRELCFKDLMSGFRALLKNQYSSIVQTQGQNQMGTMLQKTYNFFINQKGNK